MAKSATDVMQDIIVAAVLDAVAALRTASKGVPNTLLRDVNAIHANTTFADLPPELQASITGNVRAAFTRLLKEGYSVSPDVPGRAAPQRAAPDRAQPRPRRPDDARRDRPPGPRGPAPNRGGRGGEGRGPGAPRGGRPGPKR